MEKLQAIKIYSFIQNYFFYTTPTTGIILGSHFFIPPLPDYLFFCLNNAVLKG